MFSLSGSENQGNFPFLAISGDLETSWRAFIF
jgi:hypothetical protein